MPRDNENSPPPVEVITPQNMTVHIAYMRRDLDELTRNFKDTSKAQTELLQQIRDNSPSRKEFEELRTHVEAKASDSEFKKLEKYVQDNMVTKADFEPVKKFIYGAVVIICSTVFVALLGLVVSKSN